jgi:hypothetical protein
VLIVERYPGFKIESKRESPKDNYKTRIVITNIADKRVKEKLVYLATTKKLSFTKELPNIEKIVKELKMGCGVLN